jgi:hypothetical protein
MPWLNYCPAGINKTARGQAKIFMSGFLFYQSMEYFDAFRKGNSSYKEPSFPFGRSDVELMEPVYKIPEVEELKEVQPEKQERKE